MLVETRAEKALVDTLTRGDLLAREQGFQTARMQVKGCLLWKGHPRGLNSEVAWLSLHMTG